MRKRAIAALLCCGMMGMSLTTVRAAEGTVLSTFDRREATMSVASAVRGGLELTGGTEGTGEETPGDYYFAEGKWIIVGGGKYTVRQIAPQTETEIQIFSQRGATVVLQGLNIRAAGAPVEIMQSAGEIRLELKDMNTLVAGDNRAAIEKSNFSHLILSSASGDGRTAA